MSPTEPPESSETLAVRFEQANAEVLDLVERLSEPDWLTWCEREGRSVGVVTYHIAAGHLIIGEQIQAIASGISFPTRGTGTPEDAATINARQAEENATCTRDETLSLLRHNGGRVAAMLRGLTDEQLRHTALVRDRPVSLRERIDGGLFGHLRSHLAALRETLDRRSKPD
ncbi:MAG: DinB family protein [Chloroflexota bacterium]|nr:DinB family protein [Chloroflexota bacterium]